MGQGLVRREVGGDTYIHGQTETFRASHSPFLEESSLDAHCLRSFEALLRCPFVREAS